MNSVLRSAWTPLLVCLVLAFTYTFTQERIEYEGGHPYDSSVYFQMAQQVAQGQGIQAPKPFVYRLAVPYLVGQLFPEDILHGFEVIGLAFGVVLVLVLFLLLRAYGLSRAMALWMVALYIANPYAPFRFVPYLPALVDTGAFAFALASFWLFKTRKELSLGSTALLAVLGVLGALVREVVVVVPLTFLGLKILSSMGFGEDRLLSKQTLYRIVIVLCTIASLVASRSMVAGALGDYETISQMRAAFDRNWLFPEIWVLCALTAIGPLLFVIAGSVRSQEFWRFLGQHLELPIFLIGMGFLSLVAGNHTDRFVFWMLPGFLPLLGHALGRGWVSLAGKKSKWLFYGPILVAQVLAYRAFVSFPATDHETLSLPGKASLPMFMNYGEGVNLGQITVAFMTRANRIPLLFEFAVLAVYLCAVWVIGRAKPIEEPSA